MMGGKPLVAWSCWVSRCYSGIPLSMVVLGLTLLNGGLEGRFSMGNPLNSIFRLCQVTARASATCLIGFALLPSYRGNLTLLSIHIVIHNFMGISVCI